MAYGRGFNFSKFTLICALNDRTWHGMEFMYLWGWRSDFYGWVGLWQAAKLNTTQHNTTQHAAEEWNVIAAFNEQLYVSDEKRKQLKRVNNRIDMFMIIITQYNIII